MDKVAGSKAVIASGASFKGQIKNTPSIEVNGTVEADIYADKLTIGEGGKFFGAANVELVVISGHYEGHMDAGSIWATATAEISGKIHYKTIQLDRGAALNCHFIHNWKQEKITSKKTEDLPVKKGETKKGGIDIKSHKTSEANKTKKRNAEMSEKAKAGEAEPSSVAHSVDDETKTDDDFKLFADWAKKAPVKDKKLRGKRLGIFKFGSRAAKFPDVQG